MAEVVKLLKPHADTKQINITCQCINPQPLNSDRARARKILINLLNNAVKFTDSGQITLDCQALNGRILFSITDTGTDIDIKNQADIFSAFHQIDSSENREYADSGPGHLQAVCYIIGR